MMSKYIQCILFAYKGEAREENDRERGEVARLEARIDRLFFDFGSDANSTRQDGVRVDILQVKINKVKKETFSRWII